MWGQTNVQTSRSSDIKWAVVRIENEFIQRFTNFFLFIITEFKIQMNQICTVARDWEKSELQFWMTHRMTQKRDLRFCPDMTACTKTSSKFVLFIAEHSTSANAPIFFCIFRASDFDTYFSEFSTRKSCFVPGCEKECYGNSKPMSKVSPTD